jgi:hypothetical protein
MPMSDLPAKYTAPEVSERLGPRTGVGTGCQRTFSPMTLDAAERVTPSTLP